MTFTITCSKRMIMNTRTAENALKPGLILVSIDVLLEMKLLLWIK